MMQVVRRRVRARVVRSNYSAGPNADEYCRLAQNVGARNEFVRLLRSFAAQSTGSSNCIERAIIIEDAPSRTPARSPIRVPSINAPCWSGALIWWSSYTAAEARIRNFHLRY